MILPVFSYLLKSKVLASLFVFGLTLLAVAASTDNHTLLLISLFTNGTIVFGTVVSGFLSWHNSKKLSTLSVNVDGKLAELMQSREKTSHLEGAAQERTEERDRRSEKESH